jgi:hypothetical protein
VWDEKLLAESVGPLTFDPLINLVLNDAIVFGHQIGLLL